MWWRFALNMLGVFTTFFAGVTSALQIHVPYLPLSAGVIAGLAMGRCIAENMKDHMED